MHGIRDCQCFVLAEHCFCRRSAADVLLCAAVSAICDTAEYLRQTRAMGAVIAVCCSLRLLLMSLLRLLEGCRKDARHASCT